MPSPGGADDHAWGGGVRAGGELDVTARLRARLDLVGDDGYGGRRIGATAAARWQTTRVLALTGRLGGLAVATADSDLDGADGWSGVAQAAAAWQIDEGIALLSTSELASSPRHGVTLRAVVVLDLAFEPETR